MIDPAGVIEVWAPAATGGIAGSGYLIADGLILTAGHVIDAAAGGACEVRSLGEADWLGARVRWRGGPGCDAGLLAVDAPLGSPRGTASVARLGRIAGRDPVGAVGLGFPDAQARPDDVRDTEQLRGEIVPLTARKGGLLTVSLEGSVPEAIDGRCLWQGMSGAALWCEDLLVGVVIVAPEHFGADRLIAVPLTRIATDDEFVRVLAAATSDPVMLQTVEAAGVLRPAYDALPPRRARQSSSFLLGARYGVVPFRARAELDKLRDWAHAEQDVDVAVLTGQGGVGKTRLARELCRRLAREGWVTGPLAISPDKTRLARLARIDEPLLVVIDDYAEERRGDVIDALTALAERPTAGPRRLLFTTRVLGDWWKALQNALGDSELRDLLASALPVDAEIAETTMNDRSGAYREALAAFAVHTGAPTGDQVPVPDLSDSLFETVLFVHMAALSALPGAGGGIEPTEGSIRVSLLRHTLDRERQYWSRITKALDPPLQLDDHVQGYAVTVATLTASTSAETPADEDQTTAALDVIDDLADRALRRRVARWLHDLYPTRTGWIAPLEPDLLGEALVADTLTRLPRLAGDVLNHGDDATTERALTVLTRASKHHPVCHTALHDALNEQLQKLASSAIVVAQRAGDPIGVVLAGALQDQTDPALAYDLLRRIPQDTVSLREAAAVLTEQALHNASDDAGQRAALLDSYATRLSRLGRREDALTAIDEAVGVYRELAGARPDAFLPDLAMSLNNQSGRLSELGRREDALTAIDEAVASTASWPARARTRSCPTSRCR